MKKQTEDLTLIAGCLNGQARCFEALVNRYEAMIRTMIKRLVADDQHTEDLAQQTFIKAYDNLRKFEGRSRFSTWLGQIALNLARDHLRVQKRDPTQEFTDRLQTTLADPDGLDPVDLVYREQLGQCLGQAMGRLNDRDRELLTLQYFEECDNRVIADRLKCSRAAVKVRSFRARNALRGVLQSMLA